MSTSAAFPTHPLSLRSYGGDGVMHRHAHVQIVLPLQGKMEIEVGGRSGRLDVSRAAFVAPDTDHVQAARGANRFLILDCAPEQFDAETIAGLQQQTFVTLDPVLRRLLEYIDLRRQGMLLPALLVQHCMPLLIDALSNTLAPAAAAGVPARIPLRSRARLQDLLVRLQDTPGDDWNATRMAQCMHVSVSRLHVLFRNELQQTPQQWLSALRLRLVQQALAETDIPVAALAQRHGYADQSTLTRAMRRATGLTPAAYRQRQR